jgi:long-chain acyl-CoA synthetase
MRAVEVLTAADAEDRQRRIAGGLRAAGLVAGDRVALLASSSGDLLAAILGALRTGIVPVLVHAALLDEERAALLDDARPSMVVDDAGLARLLGGAPAELAPAPLARPMHYTSGTTGQPKGVWSGLLDEREADALLAEEAELWGFGPDDVHLVCSPFHHSVSIRFGAGTLLAGGTVLVPGRFEADRAAAALADGATTTFMVPAHLQRLFAHAGPTPPHRLRLLAHAGAPCPPPLKEAAASAFGDEVVWEFYGSTEGQFTACSTPEWRAHPGTVGRARPGRCLDVDADGTIWCEAPSHARFEYWRDPVKTATAWRPPTAAGTHGWFSVGDLGRLDDGYLHLDGRRDDLIISGGVNVYPAEVERVLSAAPGVQQVAVFGVPDERWGQRVCAAVVGPVVDGDVHGHARAHLAPHKRPKDVYVVDELPHTATGKVQRLRLPAWLGLETTA